ncbi:MAG: site-specific DNA-methyltransferase [Desulfobulbaceae bacterium]|nr:site-specific DNA-methyltransferase [Desulfobulbaceae bacterium]
MSNHIVDQIDRLDLESIDVTKHKIQELVRLFPETITEAGKIDFDRLRAVVGEAVETAKERYGMSWPGKADCFKTILAPSLGTLRPYSEESVNFDTTENLIIEGDNLEVLKLLQKSYIGKIRLIYIDPPYNTGSDFIYPDNYTESLQTYLQYTRQVSAEGKKFSTNTETDGRFHSKWLNMMYPRLYLARNLLRDDGVIFITIDDKEVDNLRKCCYEIFGEENFVTQIEWQKRYTRSNNTDDFTSVIDHIVVFARSDKFRPKLIEREEEANARYHNPDNDPRGPWKAIPFLNPLSPEERPNLAYKIKHPSGRIIQPKRKAWRSEESVWRRLVQENRVWWGKDGNSDTPSIKRFLNEVRQGMTPINFWSYEFAGHTDSANQELKDLLGDKIFDTPKPTRLVQRMIQLVADSEEECTVLDFFAGSGTTAHAVLDMNKLDNGNRKFILIQLPEILDPGDKNQKIAADFCDSIGKPRNLAEITMERVRRVIKKFNEEDAARAPSLFNYDTPQQDRGFRIFKLAESNFKPWNAEVPYEAPALERQLEMHIDHIREGRTAVDILYEILLKSGFPLTTPVETITMAGLTVYSVANGALFICLERVLTLELIRAMAEQKPERVVCLDEGFAGNDQLKANAVQIFKTKGVTSFKTV